MGAVAACALGVAALLLLCPPERYGFYPRCPVYASFGVLCPGCGGTRALAALLRGHLREAFGSNQLITMLALAGAPVAVLLQAATRRWPARFSRRSLEQSTAVGALAAAVVFSVWRNLR